jgi:hypothetical protein
MTDPIEDFKSNVETRKKLRDRLSGTTTDVKNLHLSGDPITDVYVVAHGWNFSIAEAVANYHGYMELADRIQYLQEPKDRSKFQPYFFFVVWPSVIRPLSDMAGAILPFGLDESIRALTTTVDLGAFFLPSVWKQSIHAAKNALGKGYPNQYFDAKRGEEYGVNSKFSIEAELGRIFLCQLYFMNCSDYSKDSHSAFTASATALEPKWSLWHQLKHCDVGSKTNVKMI